MSEVKTTIYDFYEQLLITSGHEVHEDGSVVQALTSKRLPVSISGKKLHLPLASLLRNTPDDVMFFHPLCEQMTRHESEVFKYLKKVMSLKLVTTLSTLGTALIQLQEDPSVQRNLSMEQIEVLKGISSVDAKSAKSQMLAWQQLIIKEITANPNRMDLWPIHIFLKRNGTFNGKPHRRVSVVSFPVLEDVLKGTVFLKDNKDMFRNKDYPMFRQLIEAIFPQIEAGTTALFGNGYDGTLAPYLITFLRSFKLIADHMNGLFEKFRDVLQSQGTDVDTLVIKMDWAPLVSLAGISELEVFKSRIPQLKGNVGLVEGEESEETEKTVKPSAPREPKEPPRKREEEKKPVDKQDESKSASSEAAKLRSRWADEQADLQKEAEEREARRNERAGRNRDDDRRHGERDDPPWDDGPETRPGTVSATSLFSRNPSIVRNSRTIAEEEEYERSRRRGGSRWGSRDSYDDRDDRYYDRHDDRYGRRDSGYGRRDDRYSRRDDGYGYGRRDDRRDDGYGRSARGDSRFGNRFAGRR